MGKIVCHLATTKDNRVWKICINSWNVYCTALQPAIMNIECAILLHKTLDVGPIYKKHFENHQNSMLYTDT